MLRCFLFSLVLSLMIPSIGYSQSSAEGHLEVVEDSEGVHVSWTNPNPTETHMIVVQQSSSAPQSIVTHTHKINPKKRYFGSLNTLKVPPAVTLIRQGIYRGQYLQVYGLAAQDGTEMLSFSVPSATLLNKELLLSSSLSNRPFGVPVPPSNPFAFEDTWKINVLEPGIQRLRGADLVAAGIDLDTLDPAHIHVFLNRTSLALDVRGIGDGRFDSEDELRFFIPEIGDRWNTTTTAWFVIDALRSPHRMTSRLGLPGVAPLRLTAQETQTIFTPSLYDSRYPGWRGERWYSKLLVTGPGFMPASHVITPSSRLPMAHGTMTVTLQGNATTAGLHTARIEDTLGNTSALQWSGSGPWRHSVYLSPSQSITMNLEPATMLDGVLFESAMITMPVLLDVSGRSAMFHGHEGLWRYQLRHVPPLRVLYDVTSPATPQIVIIPPGEHPVFEDGPQKKTYFLANSTSLATPMIERHSPVTLPSDGEALIIAPARFEQTLAPLIEYRLEQGIAARFVAAEDLYDAWAFGSMSPDAIRDFLRHAASTWPQAPTSVLLIGDGSYDPKNYLKLNKPTLLPPYLAEVDLWLGETACENCFVQLDGSDPLDDPLPDLLLGRLPVQSIEELEHMVQKLITYEQSPYGMWKQRIISIADNYRSAHGTLETALDFPTIAYASEQYYPATAHIHRMYYDPYLPTSQAVSWRESDATTASLKTRMLLSQGSVIVQYTGHSHAYQWAATEASAQPPYLYGLNDVEGLTNTYRQPVVLGLTCLTSGFHQVGVRGTTLDEALVLRNDGGAIATWGSSGLGVAHGHDYLQKGFAQYLSDSDEVYPRLGSLTHAGYISLFTEGNCCQDALRTFAILGDPLTRIQYEPLSYEGYIPILR